MIIIRGVSFDESVLRPPPSPWPADVGRPVLLFGGTFDPPHRAHVMLARAARDVLFGPDGVLVFVPAGRNPHKPTGPVAGAADRVAMLRIATSGDARAGVWTDEIDRAGAGEATFWVDTLARAASLLPESTPLRFLIGADQADAFDRWHEHGKIVSLAEPAVLLREPMSTREALRRRLQSSGQDPDPWMGRIVLDDVMPCVASDLRARLAQGSGVAHVAGDLPAGIGEYIERRALYTR